MLSQANGARTPARFSKLLIAASLVALSACAPAQQSAPRPFADENVSEEVTDPVELERLAKENEELRSQFTEPSAEEVENTASAMATLDPNGLIPRTLLNTAVAYFNANGSRFANKNYITIIDFAKKSTGARQWVVNMNDGSVWSMHVAHGSGSDSNHDGYAESFGNVNGSGKSSLGYYRTAETYTGKHGLSLRLDGLSSTNSNVRARAIVVHGASYVSESSVIQGRSLGCPAVTMGYRTSLINKIKGGSLIYAGLSK